MALLYDSIAYNISIFLVIVSAVILFFKYRYTYWTRNGIIQYEPSIPFGNMRDFLLRFEHIGVVLQNIYNEIKQKNTNIQYAGIYSTIKPELLLISPEIIKQILIKDFAHFTDREIFSDEKIDPLSGHLFALKGQKWKNLRTKLTPTFTSGKMKMMFHTLAATSNELTNVLEKASKNGEPLDIKDILARFTTDVIGSCSFGIECNSLKDPNVDFRVHSIQVFHSSTIDFLKIILASLIPSMFKFFQIPVTNKEVTKFFIGLVRNMVKYREGNNVFRKDFLQLLLEMRKKGHLSDDDGSDVESPNERYVGDGKSLTIEEMAAQCFVFFLAGFETSSTTMSFTLFELAQNPEIQEKAREEIVKTLEKHGEMSYNAIMEMQYLENVVNETLRKYPVVPALERICTKDYKLPDKDYTVRVGDKVHIPVLAIQRDPEYYPNPDKFDPERFSEEEKSKRPSCTYLPFGEGPRICIGLRFGLMQAKLGLAVLLKNYSFTLNNKTELPLQFYSRSAIVLSTKGDIWLNAKKIIK